jgi:hypothetical protein
MVIPATMPTSPPVPYEISMQALIGLNPDSLTNLLTIPALIPNTLYVPDDYPTIQQAINATVNGDTVIVKPGTYLEKIDFKGKAITVRSTHGADNTVIDGNQAGSSPVVKCVNGEDSDTVLEGFTVTNGSAPGGGGMFNASSSPTVTNCVFSENSSFFIGGGGMYNASSSPTVTNCTFLGNAANDGAGMNNFSSSPTVINCTFLGNSADSQGGGMYNRSSNPTVTNCTFLGNAASDGGGMWNRDSNPIVTNTVLWNNEAPEGPEIWIGDTAKPSFFTISYSDVEGGQSLVYVAPGCTLDWGPGNIDSDPLFVDPNNSDFHLTFPSPCVGSGDNAAVTELFDFEGDPRIAYGSVDMGADEFYTHLYVMGDKMSGGAITGKFVGLPGTTPIGLFVGSDVLSSPINTMWGEFWLTAPWFMLGPLGAIPADGVLELATVLPSGMTVPVDIPMQALIGLNPDSMTNLYVLKVR